MIIRNPYRITDKLEMDGLILLSGGRSVTPWVWCCMEAARLNSTGIASKAEHGQKNMHDKTQVCYVVRRREGCRFDTDGEENESFTVKG